MLLFLILGLHTIIYSSSLDFKGIEECVNLKMVDKRYRRITPHDMFAFHYGDQSVEVFNVLSQREIKTVEFLRQCIELLNAELFLNRYNISLPPLGTYAIVLGVLTAIA